VTTQNDQIAQRNAAAADREERARAHNALRGERIRAIESQSKNINGFGENYVRAVKGPEQVSVNSSQDFAVGGAGSVAPVVPSAGSVEANRRLMSGQARFYAKSASPERAVDRATRPQYNSSVGYADFQYARAGSSGPDAPGAGAAYNPAAAVPTATTTGVAVNVTFGSRNLDNPMASARGANRSRVDAPVGARARAPGVGVAGSMEYEESSAGASAAAPVSARRQASLAAAAGHGNILAHDSRAQVDQRTRRPHPGAPVSTGAAPYATGAPQDAPRGAVYSGIQRPY
jgi:hypothetical protein